MTAGLMRRFSSSTRIRSPHFSLQFSSHHLTAPRLLGLKQYQRTIADLRPRQAAISRTWFTSTTACPHPESQTSDHPQPDERTLKLGKTIRILHDRLPTLLASPLPQEILSPQITLHLFPSTHPHLPTVSGRLGYTAALWTAPVAWGRVPVVGNVKLMILSERMVKNGGTSTPAHLHHEKLIVKWKTCGKADKKQNGPASEAVEKITKIVRSSAKEDEEFSGLFLFEFDEEGRIVSHTIENVEEGGSWDRTAKVISVTDWLLGRAWGRRGEEGSPGLAYAKNERPDAARRREGSC
ncbi:uncharacterized protein BDR25DRAFT_260669 [Lindgomyces ingoldianus]|uniref:Uncharacterized protein n=1 Tax=Lindgomyces ingoldianus TaxID=673940 RepID=A0ACB6QYT6_9PLEO|nr:uncharacterized protein BDR25DRAFT_260669 [Lindgomyces ingoldianus]KAF2471262.1 hypothetical protein BDR25DRAFT_260669 [Lindgomyces ingoldianus]